MREVVSTAILTELRDPRIQNVTVLGAEISPDLRYARVRISVMGDDKAAALTMHGLESARGYLQSRVGDRVKTRYTPEIRFDLDKGIKQSFEAARILREVLPEEEQAEGSSETHTQGSQPEAPSPSAEPSGPVSDAGSPAGGLDDVSETGV